MIDFYFEWDPDKARTNLRKHGVSFEEASSVFRDRNAISIFDEAHSTTEERWITLGLSDRGKIIVVVHTFTEIDNENCSVRIISARKATKSEVDTYKGV